MLIFLSNTLDITIFQIMFFSQASFTLWKGQQTYGEANGQFELSY